MSPLHTLSLIHKAKHLLKRKYIIDFKLPFRVFTIVSMGLLPSLGLAVQLPLIRSNFLSVFFKLPSTLVFDSAHHLILKAILSATLLRERIK